MARNVFAYRYRYIIDTKVGDRLDEIHYCGLLSILYRRKRMKY